MAAIYQKTIIKFFQFLFTTILIALLCCNANVAFAASTYIITGDTTGSHSTLKDAVDACNGAPGTYAITLQGNDASQGVVASIHSGVNITLSSAAGNTYTITQQDNARHIAIDGGGSLTLKNVILEGLGNAPGGANNGGIHVYSTGVLIVGEGSTIRKCYWQDGGGIFADGSSVTLDGGSITRNQANADGGGIRATNGTLIINSGDISSNRATHGAGISANSGSGITMHGGNVTGNICSDRGGGINIDGGTTFTLISGAIANNEAKDGGGVISNGSTVNLNGGSIARNKASGDGGGLRLERSQLSMKRGATISGNAAISNGGGVYLVEWSATPSGFAMNGGVISANEARDGGGVSVNNGCTITLGGGSITENIADVDGGGIRGTNATITINSGAINANEAPHGAGISANVSSNITMVGGGITGNICSNNGAA